MTSAPLQRLLGQFPVCIQDHRDGFPQIRTCLLQSFPWVFAPGNSFICTVVNAAEAVETGTGSGRVVIPWRSPLEVGACLKAVGEAQGKISGRIIIEQLIRNMELGQFEMGYSILAPCIFSLYLHPDDYTRLTGVFDLIRQDAKQALAC